MIANKRKNGENTLVFNFLNRVFDSMKMNKDAKSVNITEKYVIRSKMLDGRSRE